MRQMLGNFISEGRDFDFEVYADGTAEVTIWGDDDHRGLATYTDSTLSKDELIELRDFLIEHTDPIS